MTGRIEAQVERFAPGFRDLILARHVMAPADFARYNANYIGGDINGGAQDVRQLFTRPVARLVPYSTPCAGSTSARPRHRPAGASTDFAAIMPPGPPSARRRGLFRSLGRREPIRVCPERPGGAVVRSRECQPPDGGPASPHPQNRPAGTAATPGFGGDVLSGFPTRPRPGRRPPVRSRVGRVVQPDAVRPGPMPCRSGCLARHRRPPRSDPLDRNRSLPRIRLPAVSPVGPRGTAPRVTGRPPDHVSRARFPKKWKKSFC
jgi:hypothetical protein